MATLTIRGLDDDVRQALRVRAARHGVSMEAEARAILSAAVAEDDAPGATLRQIRAVVERDGGWDDLVALLPDRTSPWAVSPDEVDGR